MAALVYLLCFLTSLACAGLLFRSYRQTHTRLLLWSTLCFAGLAINNLFLTIDLVLLPQFDLSLVRGIFFLFGVGTLVLGFAWDARS